MSCESARFLACSGARYLSVRWTRRNRPPCATTGPPRPDPVVLDERAGRDNDLKRFDVAASDRVADFGRHDVRQQPVAGQ